MSISHSALVKDRVSSNVIVNVLNSQKAWMLDGEDISLDDRISELRSFKEAVNVNIKLVGFDGDGNKAININEVYPQHSFNLLTYFFVERFNKISGCDLQIS